MTESLSLLLFEKTKSVFERLGADTTDVPFLILLLVAETVLSKLIIVPHVPYTEIDWEAYMQEVGFYLEGERDYTKMYGGTGPLVYPAGFLYLFTWFRKMTVDGTDIAKAQHIFTYLYILTQAVVLGLLYHPLLKVIRRRTQGPYGVWSWRIAMGILCVSKRMHSIFLLRLFNDGPTMLMLYISIYLFTKKQWNMGCLVFSLAVSLKMNVLLFAPGLLLLLLQVGPDWKTVIFIRLGLCCALPQLILGAPFLTTFPLAYLRKAFELDRVFFYKWTVNFKMISEDLFLAKHWAILLLLLHIGTLVYCAVRWCQRCAQQTGRYLFVLRHDDDDGVPKQSLSGHYICYTMLLSNFIGIVFARTLHYQFYSWYFHALPYLLWSTNNIYPLPVKILIMAMIEGAFLTFPATALSSAILQVAHFAVLVPCLIHGPPPMIIEEEEEDKATKDGRKKSD